MTTRKISHDGAKMDNSKFGIPSAEWLDYDAAHPSLGIDDEGKDDWSTYPSAIALRDFVNPARIAASRAGLAASGLGKKVRIEEHAVPVRDGATIPVRVYRHDLRGDRPVYVYFHGGGMLFGTPEGEDFTCASYASGIGPEEGGLVVVSVCYRHTPEFIHPTQIHDAWDAFEWVVANAKMLGVDRNKIVVGGISAGGLLTASVAFTEAKLAKEEGRAMRLKGQLLAIPWLIHRDVYPYELFAEKEKASIVQCKDSPILPQPRYDLFTDLFKSEGKMPVYGLASDEELKGTPKTALMVNGRDILRDESFLYAKKLERLGVPIKKHLFPGLPHAFRKWADLASSKRWDAVTLECIRWLLDDTAPSDRRGTWSIEVPAEYKKRNAHYFE